jgi:diguanylate cyclase
MAHGERAISLLKQLQKPASPRNYELLFAFTTATNEELCKDLRKALETDSCLTEEAAERIYQKHLDKTDILEQVDEVGSQVSKEMSEIMAVIESASERTGSYGESLQGMNDKLSGIESPEQLKSVLGELFDTTNDMAEYNKVLEKRLADSKSQIDELQMSLELTRVESYTDELTGLTNRKSFDQTIIEEISEAEESGDPLCLLMIDIDHFKSFNDSHGHQTGDQVIRFVAHTLKTNVKGRDCTARYGGEEFVIILPKTKLEAAITVAEQIRVAVKTKELVKKSTNESLGHVSLSIGIACYRIGESVTELIERADVCLYAAKEAGRNNVKPETDMPEPQARVSAA